MANREQNLLQNFKFKLSHAIYKRSNIMDSGRQNQKKIIDANALLPYLSS